MFLVALTGGIGAGKSTVAHMLAAHGAVVISADEIAREVVQPAYGLLPRIVERFGSTVLHADGSLNRSALADIVFSNRDDLRDLNAITHPEIFKRTQRLFDSYQNRNQVVIYDVPLLAETENEYPFDYVIVVSAPLETRVSRLVRERGMDPSAARARIRAQVGEDERNKLADVIIDTHGTLNETQSQVDKLWNEVLVQHSSQ